MNIILRGQALGESPKQVAKEIRPLIGLTTRQAEANVNYREKIFQQYLDAGAKPATAAARADKAALKYASKQHRYRAETIVLTENSFAYNRGAYMGVTQAIADGTMGRCEMVWSTAGTNRVCSRCLALKDTVVGHTDESGVTLPPLHPRCRCVIMYREVGKPRALQPKPCAGSKEDFSFDVQRFGDDKKIKLNINGFGEANIPLAKLTKYAFNPENAPDKAIAFEKALGYNLDNVGDLIENIVRNINKYEMKENTDLGYGKRFYVQMELTGANGKTANVLIAWILDKSTGEFRLTTIYVNKK